jgi:competence ComEA-like helix-hairpin-helix protein
MAQEVGTLLPIYLEEIEPLISTKAHQFLITEAAKAINEAGGHNWIPVIVKQKAEKNFQAIANIFILVAAKEAGLDKVWCIVVDDSAITEKSSQLLSQELTPKVNLATATRDEIKLGLDYLINRSVNPLVKVKLATALDKIDNPHRQYWKENFKEVLALKCGINTGKNLDIFKEVFYTTPKTPPSALLPVSGISSKKKTEKNPVQIKLNTASESELLKVPGIGPQKALDIINRRETKKIQNIEELTEIKGITSKMIKDKKWDEWFVID